jgi:hypothetical protein
LCKTFTGILVKKELRSGKGLKFFMLVFSLVLCSGSTVNIFRRPGVIVRKWLLRMWDDMGLSCGKQVLMSFVMEFVKSLISVTATEFFLPQAF